MRECLHCHWRKMSRCERFGPTLIETSVEIIHNTFTRMPVTRWPTVFPKDGCAEFSPVTPRLVEALEEIAAMATPRANSTVKRMTARALEALHKSPDIRSDGE